MDKKEYCDKIDKEFAKIEKLLNIEKKNENSK